MPKLARVAVLVAMALAAGCLQGSVTTCSDGVMCPGGKVCSAQGCVLPEQVDACVGQADGALCSFGGVVNGRCGAGVCMAFGCGNGVVEALDGEVCDDGNARSGDGCRADCRKREVCGDGLLDSNEACDDGNANAADGCDACRLTTWAATAVVGGSIAGRSVGLYAPGGVAVDALGNVFVADTGNHRIRRLDATTGIITTVAGGVFQGYGGDGAAAATSRLSAPHAVAVDGLGTIYIADTYNSRIRRVDPSTGIITTVAGNGTDGDAGDGGAATSAQLDYPNGLAVDGLGTIYIADTENNRVRRVDAATGIITTVAGTGGFGFAGDGGPATSARIHAPDSVALDAVGNLYIADADNHRVRRVDAATGIITTVAGTGLQGGSGDGGPAISAQLDAPRAMTFDVGGNLYIADAHGDRIRRVDAATAVITTVAGSGLRGGSGDDGPATSARLHVPSGVAVDGLGTLYIADTDNHRIRTVDPGSGIITTVAGTGAAGSSGDGGAATSAHLAISHGLTVDALGRLYIVDGSHHRIRRVDPATGVIETVAGTGIGGYSGDGGVATRAELFQPGHVAVDEHGNLFIADGRDRIRRVDAATGVITTVAGTGTEGFAGDGGPATAAHLYDPSSVAVTAAGVVFIADAFNHRIRRVDLTTGVISTVAGTGTEGVEGDGGLARRAQLAYPEGLAVDRFGTLYIVDRSNHRIRRVDGTTGIITTMAGTGVRGDAGDGGLATAAPLDSPTDVAVDAAGHVYIADAGNHRIRRVDATTGIITTLAGTGLRPFAGDGGAATSAQLDAPQAVAVDRNSTVYAAGVSTRIRRIDGTTGRITTVAGYLDPEGMGPLAQAHLADPRALVLTPSFTLIAGGATGTVQAVRNLVGWLGVVAGRYPHTPATGTLARFREARFETVGGVAYDAATRVLYLTETSGHRVHAVTVTDPADETTWTIAPLAGVADTAGFADGAAATARFRTPTGLHLDPAARRLYVADAGNHVIRAIDLDRGLVSTIAGTPQTRGDLGDGAVATDALLFEPEAITRCGNGDLFVADTGNHRVRRIAAGVITTVLGDGVAASSGQGTPARDFPVHAPRGLACDPTGNLYVTSTTTVRQVAADADGVVDGSGAVASIFGAPPRTFPAAVSFCLTGLAIADATTVQVTDSCTGMLIELERQRP